MAITLDRRHLTLDPQAAERWSGHMLAAFRVIAGLIFLTAGTTKAIGFPAGPAEMPPFVLLSQMGIGALLEIFGGAAIVVGLFTRPVAFVLAGEMAVAYFQFHAPGGFFPTANGGVAAVLYCFFFLYLTAAGAGPWSIDALRNRRVDFAGRRSSH
jgi:putative oxidoreductase